MVAFGATALFLTLRVFSSVTSISAAPVAQGVVAPPAPAVPAVPSAAPAVPVPSAALAVPVPSAAPAVPAVPSAYPVASAAPSSAPAVPVTPVAPATGSTGYWLADIKHQGVAPFAGADFKVFRNVKEYGAKGDGATDDTEAINAAISQGNRCGNKCDSTTVTPVILYFPPGTYMISKPIIQYYYTQFIGDAKSIPILKATAAFEGMGLIDADPYNNDGSNWFTNQNNFYRQIRNFVIDISAAKAAAGIHWQVSQATSLQNIVFEMAKGPEGANQKGIFMDNGSGGFMSDLVFNGGAIGAFLGSQQFTSRNMTFNGCDTGIYMNWNWLWTLKSINFNNCKVGLDMANSPQNQTVGSVLLLDSKFVGTPIGVNSSFSDTSIPTTGGTLIMENVDFTGSETAIQGPKPLAGGKMVKSYTQGQALAAGSAAGRVAGESGDAPERPASLVGQNGFFERSKPQYENVPLSSFVSVKDKGAKGDGKTDDTAALQEAINGLTNGQVLFIDHGAYVITKTVTIPAEKNVKIVGEIWPLLMGNGKFFADQANPKPVIQVGEKSGDAGTFEMSDVIVTTKGALPGGILIEWNVNSKEQGGAGLWDVHMRVGGFQGTELQSDKCAKSPNATHTPNEECIGSFMQLHVTKKSNGLFENCWAWVADHELDLPDHSQIDIYNGRGMVIESQGPVWLYGTASEHSQLVQYQLTGAKDIFMGHIQTETPYYQPNPSAAVPFVKNDKYSDPDFSQCSATNGTCSAWGVRIVDSESVWVYGSGTYSFFTNYDQKCVVGQNCQQNINEITTKSSNINWFGMSTKASVNMITQDGKGLALDADNRSNFCATMAVFAQA
jgi:glucan 1,3-beta-glucosidase